MPRPAAARLWLPLPASADRGPGRPDLLRCRQGKLAFLASARTRGRKAGPISSLIGQRDRYLNAQKDGKKLNPTEVSMPVRSPKADVMIVTVNKIESQAVIEAFQQETGYNPYPTTIDDRTYHDLGEVNGARIFLALSEMGSSGLGASQQAIQKGISALHPSVVIAIGIAFGVDEQKQDIGDILVSQQLLLYELQRIGKDIISRGDKAHASPKIIERFRSADIYWKGAKVHFGLILTGDKLVDNIDYRDQIKNFGPEAIGGEMEGAGLYVACHDTYVEWILVKAICDWADGNKAQDKDNRQQLAAHNAAGFVLHTLKLTSFKMHNQEGPKSLSDKPKEEIELKELDILRIQDVLYKDDVTEGKFFRAEPAWIDFEQGYILNRVEEDEIINNIESNKIQLLTGDAGAGKSTILKSIGFSLSKYNTVFYLASKKYGLIEIALFLEEILKSNQQAIFILDDIYLYQEIFENFLIKYKKLGNGQIILGSRDILLFKRHQKYLSILDNVTKISILASDIADKLIEMYLNRLYNSDSNKIAYISYRLSDYKADLWHLSWALLAYKPAYSIVNKIDIYNEVADSITRIQGKNGTVDASDVFFILSIFSRFEIPVEKRFMIGLGIKSNKIEELILLKEIIENNKNNAISIAHSSVANIYFNTYKHFSRLGDTIRDVYKNDESYAIFLDYLNTMPFNFHDSLVKLCNDEFDKREGKMLVRRLIENAQIKYNISRLEGNNIHAADIVLCMAKLKGINNKLIGDISKSIDTNQLANKLNLEGSIFDISISLLTLKGINLPLTKNLINSLDIKRISKIILDNNIYNIWALFSAFFNVDYTIGRNLVNEMIRNNNIKNLIEIMNNEGNIFINSLIIFYIAFSNMDVAINLMQSIDFNSIAENAKSEDDFSGLNIFLLILNTIISIKIKISLNLTALSVKRLICLLKGQDVLANTHFIWSLTMADKDATFKLINNTEYIEHLKDIIHKETDLSAIATLIIWLSCTNKKIAIDLFKSIETNVMLEKIQNTEKIDGIYFLLICLAFIDKSLATIYYIFAIAYANRFIVVELIKEMEGTAPNININKYLEKLLTELNDILSLSLITEYVCLYQLIGSWTLSFGETVGEQPL